MGTIQDANHVIRSAELSLRTLMEQAIREQRYADVAAIAPLAEGLSKIGGGASGESTRRPSAPSPTEVVLERKRTKAAKEEYPRFLRDGDKLVKVGWSKKLKSEYEHRATLAIVEAFLASIRAKVRDGQLFAATDVIPVKSSDEAVPDYQAYLALKWLHTEGVVTKHGRDRYAVEPGRIGSDGLKPIWNRLPTIKAGGAG